MRLSLHHGDTKSARKEAFHQQIQVALHSSHVLQHNPGQPGHLSPHNLLGNLVLLIIVVEILILSQLIKFL